MDYTTFGSTGTTVSELCLGCMSFGTDWDDWTLGREESRELIERAIELGINFFDTANVYSYGESEEILGEVLAEYDRDEMVVATKVYGQMRDDDPNSGGLSRKAIEQELDNSLDRLGMDTIDLYQIHRWDYDTPIEQTLRALDDAVRRGKVRHVGASSMWAYQFADALYTSDRLGLERFVSMQNLYNLAYREEEREMLPLCAKEDVAVMPWSPLAAGFLTRPHEEFESTTRGEHEADVGRPYEEGGGPAVNERVQELAEEKDVKMAQIALAWQVHKDWVTTPIVGTSSIEHLEDAVEALDIKLSSSDIDYLEEPYQSVRVSGHE
ncbi:aldo/keto reductase [Haloferax sp. MBLA0076]|uniref:Aldo/keto reductase n=1 Tax=Haloferax litoreum TaxID=2666140 RepID=A0A6A8GJG2_9EURY|nr:MULTISPECIES: aldo/keto reductase [Haloferax]KAB1193342.1 aldo/keto reductase [Haloferax sp. CBA1148]MRX21850.1 aldo/keto reductase [Haloferax litoreum]